MNSTGSEVFLGGACNPTTWRKDIAIPFLKKHGISFYNPQMDDWRPELIEMENNAKENAKVFLFVLDPFTRGIATIIEIAFLCGKGKRIVLVHPPKCLPFYKVGDDILEKRELEEIREAHCYLLDLFQQKNIPVCTSVADGLEAVRNALQQQHCSSYPRRLVDSGFYEDDDDAEESEDEEVEGDEVFRESNQPEDELVLFMMTRESRSIRGLAEAAHNIAVGRKMVLFVETFLPTEKSKFRMSRSACKDYNRGREYLLDVAVRADVLCAKSSEEAERCAITMAGDV